MIDVKNFSAYYDKGEKIINNISFHINAGDSVGLIGANGSGKSTLFKALLGLTDYEGEATVGNIILCKKNLPDIRKLAGCLMQSPDNQMFMPKVIDDMIFGPLNYGVSPSDATEKAEKVLSELGALHLKDCYNHKLSGGEKSMAALGVILTMEPEILLLDEPTASLDLKSRRNLINVLKAVNKTKIIATHDLDFVLETCQRVIILNKGKISAEGEALTILSNKELLEENSLEKPFCMQNIK